MIGKHRMPSGTHQTTSGNFWRYAYYKRKVTMKYIFRKTSDGFRLYRMCPISTDLARSLPKAIRSVLPSPQWFKTHDTFSGITLYNSHLFFLIRKNSLISTKLLCVCHLRVKQFVFQMRHYVLTDLIWVRIVN